MLLFCFLGNMANINVSLGFELLVSRNKQIEDVTV